jgi:hypothetical protein
MSNKQPPSTRQFFLVTVALSALAFIPVIGWMSAFFLPFWIIIWMVMEPKGFFSVVWRTILCVVLIYSVAVIIETFHTRHELATRGVVTRGLVNVYEDPYVIGGIIASTLSILGLMRSFFTPHAE